MSVLKRVWSKVWTEPRPRKPAGDTEKVDKSDDPNASDLPIVIETDLFQFALSPEWKQVSALDTEQHAFDHAASGLHLVFSTIFHDIPLAKLNGAAVALMDGQIEAVDIEFSRKGLYPVGSHDEVTTQTWGEQVTVIRRYANNDLYRFFGFVSSPVTLLFTFEGTFAPDDTFDLEVENVIRSIQFADAVWAGRDMPLQPTMH